LQTLSCSQALFHAIENNRYSAAKLLIETGIDLTVQNKFGQTAQSFAESENREEILSLFPKKEISYEIPIAYMSYNRIQDIVPLVKGEV
jgi:ankyrin repeat protein